MHPASLLSRRIRLRHMIVATTVAHHGSVRQASEVLHLTQPAASRSLAELEDILGLKLFERGPKGMTLTDAGAALIAHMHVVVSEVGSLTRHAEEIVNGGRGKVRVGTLLAGAADVLPSALVALTRQFPEIQVEVSEGTPDRLYESLMFGHVDFVVGRVMPLASIPGVESERLYDDEVRVVCTPDHPRATHTGTLGELVDDAWVLPPSDTSLRAQIEEDFIRDCGRTPISVIECVAAMPLRSLVLRGELLAVVPSGIFTDELERGSLVALPMQVGGAPVAVGIVSRAGAEMTASAVALVDALRAAVADRPST